MDQLLAPYCILVSELDMCMLPDLQGKKMLLRQGDGGTELLELLLQLLGLLLGDILLERLGDRLDKLLRLKSVSGGVPR
jgi:hypothetical protein